MSRSAAGSGGARRELAAVEEPLHGVDAQGDRRLELFCSLDALQHRPRAQPAGDAVVRLLGVSMVFGGDNKPKMMVLGLWYIDTFVRTPDGWRFQERTEQQLYSSIVPKVRQ